MVELKHQIEKMEKDIKSLVANQKRLKEEIKNSSIVLKKEIEKDEIVMVLEIMLDEKLDIMNEKQKYLDEKIEQH